MGDPSEDIQTNLVQEVVPARVVTVISPGHHEILVSGLWNFLQQNRNVDFRVGTIRAHKVVLEVFLPAAKLDPSLDDPLPIEPEDIQAPPAISGDQPASDGGLLDSLIEFVYNGRVSVPESSLDDLLAIARRLEFHLLADAVEAAKTVTEVAAAVVEEEQQQPEVVVKPEVRSSRRIPNRQRRKGNPVKRPAVEMDSSDVDETEEAEWTAPVKRRGRPSVAKRLAAGRARSVAARKARQAKLDAAKAAGPGFEVGEDEDGAEIKTEELGESPGQAETLPPRRRAGAAARRCRTAGGRAGRSTAEQCRMWMGRQELLQCGHCEFETRRKYLFDLHMAKHDPSLQIFKCPKCSKTFMDHDSQMRHLAATHAHEPALYNCQVCSHSTPNKRTHRNHQRVVHKLPKEDRTPAADRYRCDQCDFACVHACKLKLHVLMKHSEGQEKPFKCDQDQCTYSSIRKSDLEKHVKGAHLRLRPFVCEMCGQACAHQTALKQHLRTHTGEKPYICGTCGVCYGDPSSFKQHLKRHISDEKPYVCHLCGHRCRRRDNLRVHLKGVHKTTLEQVRSALQM